MNNTIIIIAVVLVIAVILAIIMFFMRNKAAVKPSTHPNIPLPELTEKARKIVEYAVTYFIRKEKKDLRNNSLALRRLYEAALKAEEELMTNESALISLPFVSVDDVDAINLEIVIYRDLFEGK